MTPEQIQEAKDAISSSLNRLEDCAIQLSATGQSDVAFVLRSNASILKHTATIALQRYEALVAENAKLLEKAEKLASDVKRLLSDEEGDYGFVMFMIRQALAEWEAK